ncbi:hypothetical protein GCM10022248_19680 [Nonomuraea soli]
MTGRAKSPLTQRDRLLFNHVWMTRLDDELYSGLDDNGQLVEERPQVGGLGSTEPDEKGVGLA